MTTAKLEKSFSREQARTETDETKEIVTEFGEVAGRLDHALRRLHDHGAHIALGYKSWRAFVREEFDSIDVSRSYQLIRHSHKVELIEAETGHDSGLNESQTRRLPETKAQEAGTKAAAKIKDGADPKTASAAAVKETIEAAKAKDSEPVPDSDEKPTEVEVTPEAAESAISLQEALDPPMLSGITVAYATSAGDGFDLGVADDAFVSSVLDLLRECPNVATLNKIQDLLPLLFTSLTTELWPVLTAESA